jgi:hypothetical protein
MAATTKTTTTTATATETTATAIVIGNYGSTRVALVLFFDESK